jgi:hypothetical protein
VAQLCPRALGSLYVGPCDSQGYGGGILTLPQPGRAGPRIYITQGQDGPVKSHVTTDGQSISMSWCLVHAAVEFEFQSDIRRGTQIAVSFRL